MPITEISTEYRSRPIGSVSKLRTFADGLRILAMIVRLIKEERPLQFFSAIGFGLLTTGVVLSVPVFVEFARSGMVPRLPTAVLSTGLVLLAFISQGCGLILDLVARGRKEIKRLAYLAFPSIDNSRKSGGDPAGWRDPIPAADRNDVLRGLIPTSRLHGS